MEDDAVCTCGHIFDEHGGDDDHPGSTACNVDDCDCICFDEDAEEE